MPTVEMMYDKRPTPTIYAICINENREETLRVLQLLFNYGYVFDARRRLKAIPKFLEEYGLKTKTKFCDWFWIILNKDEECKMVISAWSCMPSYAVEITVEDFLKFHASVAVLAIKKEVNNTNVPTNL